MPLIQQVNVFFHSFFNLFRLPFRFFLNPFNPESGAYEYRRVHLYVPNREKKTARTQQRVVEPFMNK
jgi:hypothetical protein